MELLATGGAIQLKCDWLHCSSISYHGNKPWLHSYVVWVYMQFPENFTGIKALDNN